MTTTRRRVLAAAAAAVAVLLAASVWLLALGGPIPNGTVGAYEAYVDDDRHLTLLTPGCESSPRVDRIEYDDTQVTVRLRGTRYLAHHDTDCFDEVRVTLGEPLDGRTLIDASSGLAIPQTDA